MQQPWRTNDGKEPLYDNWEKADKPAATDDVVAVLKFIITDADAWKKAQDSDEAKKLLNVLNIKNDNKNDNDATYSRVMKSVDEPHVGLWVNRFPASQLSIYSAHLPDTSNKSNKIISTFFAQGAPGLKANSVVTKDGKFYHIENSYNHNALYNSAEYRDAKEQDAEAEAKAHFTGDEIEKNANITELLSKKAEELKDNRVIYDGDDGLGFSVREWLANNGVRVVRSHINYHSGESAATETKAQDSDIYHHMWFRCEDYGTFEKEFLSGAWQTQRTRLGFQSGQLSFASEDPHEWQIGFAQTRLPAARFEQYKEEYVQKPPRKLIEDHGIVHNTFKSSFWSIEKEL